MTKTFARLAGAAYLGTIVTGSVAAFASSGRVAANLAATAFYVTVTILLYVIFRPVSRGLSLLAALFSFVGCALGAMRLLDLAPAGVSTLAFFGVYCLLIGYLVFKSTFLPRFLGVLMAIGGASWLTFAVPALSSRLVPFNMLPGILGETALTLWLLVMGLDVGKWKTMAGES